MYRDVREVLSVLEDVARLPNLRSIDLQEEFRWEKWSIFQDIYEDGDAFAEDIASRFINSNSTSRFMSSLFQLDNVVSILDVLSSLAKGLQAHLKPSRDSIVTKLSKGISSLPKEILIKIFQMAVWGEGSGAGQQAILLSQVSHEFREITLQTRDLWTTLNSYDPPLLLEMFISRAGLSEEYHVFFHPCTEFGKDDVAHFADTCQSSIPRWKTLTVKQSVQESLAVDGAGKFLDSLTDYFEENNLKLSSLEELNVLGYWGLYQYSSLGAYKWASRLHSVRCTFILLHPTPANLESVSTFFISLNIELSIQQLTRLLDLLRVMPVLSSLELDLLGVNISSSHLALSRCQTSRITSFHLRLRALRLEKFQAEHSCVSLLMDALRMPSLEELHISVVVWDLHLDDDRLNSAERINRLSSLSRSLLPFHLSNCSRLTSLSYDVSIDEDWNSMPSDYHIPPDSTLLIIPFDRISHIPTVEFSSLGRVVFVHEAGEEDLRNIGASTQCRLQEMKFVGCKDMVPGDLKRAIDSMESLGVWNSVKRVVMENCAHLSYDEVVDVVGKEKLYCLY
ncbi:hypothetical protein SCHPADRAFT_887924 [Schizopora paradoxa]|uniref:Uncharacterized protein n=1 Tax=Schizopora paradoxa TaxID=27342 RepID=A0A0H2SGG4_9AGAM|nr:hypothetical protein SCHPADRAFT_887924 [Schizopora paradoxa]